MFWRNTGAECRGPRCGNACRSVKTVVLPGAIGVAGVIADHEITITLGDGTLAAAFGRLGRLHGGSGGCRAAPPRFDRRWRRDRRRKRTQQASFSWTSLQRDCRRQSNAPPPASIVGTRNHHTILFVCREGLEPQRQDGAEPGGMGGVIGQIVAGLRMQQYDQDRRD